MDYVEQAGIRIAKPLYEFVNTECLPGTSIGADVFWSGFAGLLGHLAPQCKALLDKRDSIQQQIDAWHLSNKGKPADTEGYLSFLRGIGYLVGEPASVMVATSKVDAEIATLAGPQLVVPVTNARYALNAANARWGSLYDACTGPTRSRRMAARPVAAATTRYVATKWWPGLVKFSTGPRR